MAVKKKTTKKAAKRSSSVKKTVPKLKKISVEELLAVMAETDARMAKSREEADKAFKEMCEANQKSHEETDKALQRLTENLENTYGGVSRRLGTLTELVVVPKLRHNMNEQGHHFDRAEPDTLIRGIIDGRKEDIAQVDMFLYGPTEAMAVEIKSRLKESAVRVHLGRLKDLRDYEEEAGIKGKKLFGAVVGVAIDEFARKVARENGLYIVKIHEEEGKLDVEKPEMCRTW
jgi:hypothetical protein